MLSAFNPGEPMGSLMDFTLSNARRFYSSTWKVLGFSRVNTDTRIVQANVETLNRCDGNSPYELGNH